MKAAPQTLRPMLRAFRPAALLVALTAMLLGAMMPAGWMPGASGMPVMCSMDAGASKSGAPQTPLPGDDGHRHECPFAAAPHLATPVALPVPGAPAAQAAAPRLAFAARLAPSRAHAPHAARAPPLPV